MMRLAWLLAASLCVCPGDAGKVWASFQLSVSPGCQGARCTALADATGYVAYGYDNVTKAMDMTAAASHLGSDGTKALGIFVFCRTNATDNIGTRCLDLKSELPNKDMPGFVKGSIQTTLPHSVASAFEGGLTYVSVITDRDRAGALRADLLPEVSVESAVWTEIPNKCYDDNPMIRVSYFSMPSGTTLEKCKSQCFGHMSAGNHVCKGFEYGRSNGKCYLLSELLYKDPAQTSMDCANASVYYYESSYANIMGGTPPDLQLELGTDPTNPAAVPRNAGLGVFWYKSGSDELRYKIHHTVTTDSPTIHWLHDNQNGAPMSDQAVQLTGPFDNPASGTASGLSTTLNAITGRSVANSVSNMQFYVSVSTGANPKELLGRVTPVDKLHILPSPPLSNKNMTGSLPDRVKCNDCVMALTPSRIGAVGATLTFAATTAAPPDPRSLGNELWFTLPDGFTTNDPEPTTVIWPMGISAPASVFARGNEVLLRWNEGSGPTWNQVGGLLSFQLHITNLRLPNSCTISDPVLMDTMECKVGPLRGTSAQFRNCSRLERYEVFFNATATAKPLDCGTCAGCVYQSTDEYQEDAYICRSQGETFGRSVRESGLGLPRDMESPCHDANQALAGCGLTNPRNLAAGCTSPRL